MAAIDYRMCDVCGRKTFYDAGLNYEEDHSKPDGLRLEHLGDWAVICDDCSEVYECRVVRKGDQE